MRIIDYLDTLNWTQNRLSQEAHVSISTVQRLVQAKPISRQNAEKICEALSNALHYSIAAHDINEIHVTRAERPERRKQQRKAQEGLLLSPGSDQSEGTATPDS